MYTKFYGLKAKPFRLVPNPAYIYLSSRHQNALTYLEYGLTENVGFIMLTGDIGMGKTTLVRHILNNIEAETDVEVAVIFNTIVFSSDLLKMILGEFEIEYDPDINKADALELLYKHLIACYSKGKKVLLIIDEAQNLTNEVLEEIRMLSNLQTDDEMLLQIMIVGQPELKEKLRSRTLHQFAQRIAVSYHLAPMDAQDTLNYISHRLKIAGCSADLFSNEAIDMITKASSGIPRVINLLCDACLVYGFADEVNPVSAAIVEQVLADKGGMGLYTASETDNIDSDTDGIIDLNNRIECQTGQISSSKDGSEEGSLSGYTKGNGAPASCCISKDEYQVLCHRIEMLENSVQMIQTQVESHIDELKSRAEFCRDQLIKNLQRLIIIEKSQNLKIAFDYVSRMKESFLKNDSLNKSSGVTAK
ncbi:MAG: AAA family ATPase [Desulfamplus sp.]|nr:AAA family ATPase [Desulfamplus sp.]